MLCLLSKHRHFQLLKTQSLSANIVVFYFVKGVRLANKRSNEFIEYLTFVYTYCSCRCPAISAGGLGVQSVYSANSAAISAIRKIVELRFNESYNPSLLLIP